jgi:hypothetical protein
MENCYGAKIIIEFAAQNFIRGIFCVRTIYAYKNKFSQNTQTS